MRQLILIRHSKVAIDPEIPSHEWRLSANGRFLSHTLAPKIAPYQPVVFVTSEESKAAETGQIIADDLGVPWHTAPDLQEHDRTGTPFFESRDEFETAVFNFFTHPDELLLGRETAVATRKRFTQAINHTLIQYPTGNIAIVAHGTVITLFIAHFNQQIDPFPFWRQLQLPDFYILDLPNFNLNITSL